MPSPNRKAKIIATVGPALNTAEKLEQAILSGVNVFRLNFSHGDHVFYKNIIQHIRKISTKMRVPVGILQDLQGPKIRVASLDRSLQIGQGDTGVIFYEKHKTPRASKKDFYLPIDFKNIHDVVKKGTRIFINDGLIELKVLSAMGNKIKVQTIHGGVVEQRKGVAIPGVDLPLSSLTKKDLKNLDFGLKHQVDYVALSFVKSPKDILLLKKEIKKRTQKNIRVVAKIEMLQALKNLEDIIQVSDLVMVARGDLCIELGASQLPGYQKHIIKLCNKHHTPVITATQMLESMTDHSRPTRAEITDVANAVLDGSDSLMLSGETASGKHPIQCIQTMHEIIVESEKSITYYTNLFQNESSQSVNESIAASACLSAYQLQAKAIVCLTSTGGTATWISSFRPDTQIIAATHIIEGLNSLSHVWGLRSILISGYKNTEEAMKKVKKTLLTLGVVKKNDIIILTLGLPIKEKASTNSLKIYKVK